MNTEEIVEKYENSVLKNLNKENVLKIIEFLKCQNCDFLEDILENYLDLFLVDFNDFVTKYKLLNEKYNNKFLEEASFDLNKLEEFYN